LDLTILSFIFVTMLYNATNIRNIIDKKKTLEGLLSKKSQNQTVKLPGLKAPRPPPPPALLKASGKTMNKADNFHRIVVSL
ncbi:MAG: hypothetical protein J6M31_00080, partial [Bacteroidales bacterium]|nr:hypothetical protein [Bacteroidales bacterium]